MPIMFNTNLLEAGLHLADVRLLRHKDNRAAKRRIPLTSYGATTVHYSTGTSRLNASKAEASSNRAILGIVYRHTRR
jgi:hypothetical protein